MTDFSSLRDPARPASPKAPAALNGRELEELLNPVSCEDFVDRYFARQSLYVKGHAGKFDHIFSMERLRLALARGQHIEDPRFNLTASFAGGEKAGSRKPMFSAQLGEASDLLKSGATICITNIHMADPFLARWAQAIRARLSFTGTVGVNCYASPDGAGLPMHYDRRVATTLQIAGKKRWIYSTEAAKRWPDNNATYFEGQAEPADIDVGTLPDDMAFQEVELNPGDLLCLPAGAWHAARGVGYSLALNLYFAPRNLFEQLAPLLQDFAASQDSWRGGPPVTLDDAHGSLPDTVSDYMRDRLAEFQTLVGETLAGPEAMSSPWLTSLTQGPYTGWQPDPVLPLPTASATDRFRVVMPPLRFIASGGRVSLPCDNGLLDFPANFAPILRRLSSEPAGFSIPDIIAGPQGADAPPQAEIIAHLQTLFRNGIIAKSDPPHMAQQT